MYILKLKCLYIVPMDFKTVGPILMKFSGNLQDKLVGSLAKAGRDGININLPVWSRLIQFK